MGLLKSYFKPNKAPASINQVPSGEHSTELPSSGVSTINVSVNTKDSLYSDEVQRDIILSYLFQKQCISMWIQDLAGTTEGVILKHARNEFLTMPITLKGSAFHYAMIALNVKAAMTVKSRVIWTIVQRLNHGETGIPIRDNQRIQIVANFLELSRARKHQYAAFVKDECLLVVWDGDPSNLIHRIESIEADLLRVVWRLNSSDDEEKAALLPPSSDTDVDEETQQATEIRPTRYYYAIMCALSLCLLTVLFGRRMQSIFQQVAILGRYTSIAFVALTPIMAILTLFFTYVIVGFIAQLIGPVQHLHENSENYSAVKAPRLRCTELPHVTIQCPVYKEGLEAVIKPTVRSVMKAISTYELQGGSASIFINDDGLQLLDEEQRLARIQFYQDNNIGWVARPAHDPKGTGFVRRGKFKKASNMNYALNFSNRVEERLLNIRRDEKWTSTDEGDAYEQILGQVLDEQVQDQPKAWAAGNIRVGDYILIIDSDTRIPSDCLLDAVSEMELSPTVAIIQFASGVMQVSHDFFENGMTFFTRLIYTSIRFGVAAGDIAPFVGHNAMLRWSALQHVAFEEAESPLPELYWSETSVSEDFDMALRLQIEGYQLRYASYFGDGFQEGVSLTVYDEITRWEKYAYGCDELMFHPLKSWLFRGPFTPLFKKFLGSSIPLCSKLSIISYIGTYYALGSAWIMTLANYIALGLFNGYLDRWYTDSWQIFLSVILVFSVAANFGLAVSRYRSGERAFLPALYENFAWALMFCIFFGGISLYISQALLSHMFGIDMQWGSTAKEVTRTNFFIELPVVFKKFKWSMLFCVLSIIGIIIMATGPFIPWSWNIQNFNAIFPFALLVGCHLLVPIILNPGLTAFTW
ncbi:Putative glycosyltransferase 2, nucleotide-diphospho-sugar transferase [Septoria linicola]|uniref:Glycosyltransferase 2, nucleotide-diphospho-sugar transferase n=1 Tax=Septoria linicola TaxID=215465 RepID=A0A9Q9AWD3_9PEZI|nr:Putative glycosyltransferase 2, nucleotide-diphospho-sugar transferase [Septoria linicola]